MTTKPSKKHPISRLGELLFCEYKVYLKYVKKKDAKVTQKMKDGTAAHNKLQEENKKKRQKIKAKKKDYKKKVEKVKKDRKLKPKEKKEIIKTIPKPPKTNLWREVKVLGSRLKGRMDELKITKDKIIITDDKSSDRAFDSDIMQVYAYCLAYSEQHPEQLEEKIIEARLRNHKTGVVSWVDIFTDAHKQKVNDCIDRLEGILDGSIEPVATTSSAKCRYCNCYEVCDKRVEDYDINDLY